MCSIVTGPVLGACFFSGEEVDAFECCCNKLTAEVGAVFVEVTVCHGLLFKELEKAESELLAVALLDEILELQNDIGAAIRVYFSEGNLIVIFIPFILHELTP